MNTVTAVILAAGRGSRMKGLTEEKPKCLLELAGRPLLHWQLDAVHAAGITDVRVVRGYRASLLTGDFITVDNPRWADTNMVQTLLCALPHINDRITLVSYADIVYKSAHVQALLDTPGDICLTYDTDWEALWRLRNENPLDDAENFCAASGKLLDIGGQAKSLAGIQGQYMGLLKFSPKGQRKVNEYMASLPQAVADKLDMTSLLKCLLTKGADIRVCAVSGGWCECDTEDDIRKYEQVMRRPEHWSHDWR